MITAQQMVIVNLGQVFYVSYVISHCSFFFAATRDRIKKSRVFLTEQISLGVLISGHCMG